MRLQTLATAGIALPPNLLSFLPPSAGFTGPATWPTREVPAHWAGPATPGALQQNLGVSHQDFNLGVSTRETRHGKRLEDALTASGHTRGLVARSRLRGAPSRWALPTATEALLDRSRRDRRAGVVARSRPLGATGRLPGAVVGATVVPVGGSG
ncbi:hypothetical protein NL676_013541 [Syzygium grande]|nr:hypothetical protein NL676_013541 [Syzygium grande]